VRAALRRRRRHEALDARPRAGPPSGTARSGDARPWPFGFGFGAGHGLGRWTACSPLARIACVGRQRSPSRCRRVVGRRLTVAAARRDSQEEPRRRFGVASCPKTSTIFSARARTEETAQPDRSSCHARERASSRRRGVDDALKTHVVVVAERAAYAFEHTVRRPPCRGRRRQASPRTRSSRAASVKRAARWRVVARAETNAVVADEWISEEELERSILPFRLVVFAATFGEAERDPIRGTVTRATVALGIHERLGEVDGVSVERLPVGGEAARSCGRAVRREVRDADPRQDQKTAFGTPTKRRFSLARLDRPPMCVSRRGEMPRRGRPAKGSDRTTARCHQVFEVLADRLAVNGDNGDAR